MEKRDFYKEGAVFTTGTELRKTYQRESLSPQYPYMPKAEWEKRISKARGLMADKGLDAIMILNNQDALYFLGSAKVYRYEYPYVGIIPHEGPVTAVSEVEQQWEIDRVGYAEMNIGYRGDPRAPTATAAEPVKLVAEVMQYLGLQNKTIGMEFGRFMWWDGLNMNEWERLKKELPKAKFVDATDLIWEMRMIKSDWEIQTMRHLYRVASKGYFQIINNAGLGKNEKQLFYDALKIWMDEGIIESSGYALNAMESAHPFRDRILKEGDTLILDGGISYKGYTTDTQRMIYIGEPSKEVRRLARAARRGQEAVEDILKAGITAGEIFAAGYSKVAEEDPDVWKKIRARRMSGWAGHGEGLNLHEPPFLTENEEAIMKEGMVISVEIGAFYRGQATNFPEDGYLITKDGFEKLTKNLGPMDIYIKT